MTDYEFRCFLDLMMCSDPWPLTQEQFDVLVKFADRESLKRGFPDWIGAYHGFMKPEARAK